jgi:hypothetical protein
MIENKKLTISCRTVPHKLKVINVNGNKIIIDEFFSGSNFIFYSPTKHQKHSENKSKAKKRKFKPTIKDRLQQSKKAKHG